MKTHLHTMFHRVQRAVQFLFNSVPGRSQLALTVLAAGLAGSAVAGTPDGPHRTGVSPTPAPLATTLRILHRDASNGQLNTNAIYPYLILDNTASAPISYSTITVRYWFTVENPAPVTNLTVYSAQIGATNVMMTFVPLSPARVGATGYVEYSFKPAAGTLAGFTNSGPINTAISKQNYSNFNQADDYSFVRNEDFAPNDHITAYQNGTLIWGTEPAGGTPPLTLTASANPTMILTTGTTTLSATASGGTMPYSYAFAGPGTITPSGNTATVSGLTSGVKTFTVTATDATAPVVQTVSTTVSVTVTMPANTPPVATTNASQSATVGVPFSYIANAFTDAETPNGLTYSATIVPPSGLTFNPATRVISGTPTMPGMTTVTITATDPSMASASTSFIINIVPTNVRVLHREASNGQVITNGIYPYFMLDNFGSPTIPYSELTARYWFTVENPAPVTNLTVFNAPMGIANVMMTFVSLSPARSGATGYVEYSFKPAAGSLAGLTKSGSIDNGISKSDNSLFNQSDDYSYVLNRDFTANLKFTAYRNGVLIWGVEPGPVAVRLAAEETDAGLHLRVLGNPVRETVEVEVNGAEGSSLTLLLSDTQGRLVGQRTINQAGVAERVQFSVGHQATGMLFLRATTSTQQQTIRVLKAN